MSALPETPAPNPLLIPSTLEYELPPFAQIGTEHFEPAFEAGMAEQLAQVAQIVAQEEPATLDNTVIALERSGQILGRTSSTFFNLVSSDAGPELRRIEAAVSPLLAAHSDRIQLDAGLFARIDDLHSRRHDLDLDPESLRLVERYHLDFVRAGAGLGAEDSTRLQEINQELASLSTTFHQNLQAATEAAAVVVDDPAELAGLTTEDIAAAGQAAADRGHDGKYLLTLILPTGQPLLARLENRQTRRRLHTASVERAGSGEFDNGPVAVRMAQLRAVRARLLGYASHAAYIAANGTAGTPAAIDALLARMVEPAVNNSRSEAARIAEYAAADGVELAAWDWAYYSAKVQADRYSVDTASLRTYFELDAVLENGVFHAAEKLYGLTFALREDLVGYHPDVRIWEVKGALGQPIGLYLGDYYARETKRGGAWMNSFVRQSSLLDQWPVIVNNMNVTKPVPGEPTLLTLDEVNTLFHEFGHALHGLFSEVTYPRFSGTSVPRDFVEFPSQVNEMWALWPEVLANYARHVVTGESFPEETAKAVTDAALWGEGFRTAEYLAATVLDQAWHRLGPDEKIEDAADFERAALEKAGLADDLVPPRYRSTYFQHIFAGGYSAGYYSYIWAEVLDADTVDVFTSRGGLTRANGDEFRQKLLSRGGSVDPMAAITSVLGREPRVEPLLRRRGLLG
ncbi:M3 family peptidase [Nakamurella silvestris]|nr:M3 family peptidase [Nakamurella silvestris]